MLGSTVAYSPASEDSYVLHEPTTVDSSEICALWSEAIRREVEAEQTGTLADDVPAFDDEPSTCPELSHELPFEAVLTELNQNLCVAMTFAMLVASLAWLVSSRMILIGAITYAAGNLVNHMLTRHVLSRR
jgi:hypothetical protein